MTEAPPEVWEALAWLLKDGVVFVCVFWFITDLTCAVVERYMRDDQ